jgi:hypothetical protein
MFDAIICHNIFPDEKDMLADTKKGFYSIYSENKKSKKRRKKNEQKR